MVAVRWYLRYGLSHRDVEELLAERGVEVDQDTPRWRRVHCPSGKGCPAGRLRRRRCAVRRRVCLPGLAGRVRGAHRGEHRGGDHPRPAEPVAEVSTPSTRAVPGGPGRRRRQPRTAVAAAPGSHRRPCLEQAVPSAAGTPGKLGVPHRIAPTSRTTPSGSTVCSVHCQITA
jgi:hypothetical protein